MFFVTLEAIATTSYPLGISQQFSLQLHDLSNSFPGHYQRADTPLYSQVHVQLYNMHATTLIFSTGLAFALAPTGVLGWAQAGNGVWVANNVWYGRVGNCKSATSTGSRPPEILILLY